MAEGKASRATARAVISALGMMTKPEGATDDGRQQRGEPASPLLATLTKN
jgi:hypothetical protein